MRPMVIAGIDGFGRVARMVRVATPWLVAVPVGAQIVQPGAGMPPSTIDVDGPFRAVPQSPLLERDTLSRAQTRLYGRLAIGAVTTQGSGLDADSRRRQFVIGSATRSFVGLVATDSLDGGWTSQVHLEHSLDLGSGTESCIRRQAGCATDPGPAIGSQDPPERGKRFWHGRSTVGIGHRELGQIDLGRLAQPAWLLALALDPWIGNTVASPRERLYQAPADSKVATSERPESLTRTDNSITYSSRPDLFWRWSLQGAAAENGSAAPTHGFAVSYERGDWYAGGGGQRWRDGSFAVPAGVVYTAGTTRYFGATTLGRLGRSRYRTLFGAVAQDIMGKGEPTRHTWTAGVSRTWSDALDDGLKGAVGYRYRLSLRTSIEFTAALERRSGGTSRAFEAGLVHHFSRDLR